MTNLQNIQNLKTEEIKKLKQISELKKDIRTIHQLIASEQRKLKKIERSVNPIDIERFNEARKRYHHIDYTANGFRVSVQVDGIRIQKRFVSLDEAVKLRDEKLYGKYY